MFRFLQRCSPRFRQVYGRNQRRILSFFLGIFFVIVFFWGQTAIAQSSPPSNQISSHKVVNITDSQISNSQISLQPSQPSQSSQPSPASIRTPADTGTDIGADRETTKTDAATPAGRKGAIAPPTQRNRLLPQREAPNQLPDDYFSRVSTPEGFPRSLPEAIESEAAQSKLDSLLPPARFPVTAAKEEIRGVWMTNHDMAILRDPSALGFALKQLARLNFNTIYPVVWNGGYTLHPSDVARNLNIPHVYRGSQDQDILANLIEQAHQEGLSVVPWFEYGLMIPPESELARAHPDWLTQKRNGDLTSQESGHAMAWLNPLRPEVQQFWVNLVSEVVSKYNVDGIQFDDHMSLPSAFGYDSYTLAAYQQEHGHDAPPNPRDEAWVRWRAQNLTSLVAQLHSATKRLRPNALFSLSPNAYRYAYSSQLQDWLTWVRRGYIEELIVQVYRSDLRGFINLIETPEMQEAQGAIATGVGILTGLTRQPIGSNQIKKQVQAAHQRGLGVSFFFYRSLWDDAPEPIEDRLALFQSLFPRQSLRLARR